MKIKNNHISKILRQEMKYYFSTNPKLAGTYQIIKDVYLDLVFLDKMYNWYTKKLIMNDGVIEFHLYYYDLNNNQKHLTIDLTTFNYLNEYKELLTDKENKTYLYIWKTKKPQIEFQRPIEKTKNKQFQEQINSRSNSYTKLKNMKIKKEFVPLILNGTKKYEFRNSYNKQGIYEINNKKFLLLFVNKLKTLKSIDSDEIIFILESTYKIKVDEASKQWIKNNINYFSIPNSIYNNIYLYRWIDLEEFNNAKLEVI